MVIVLSIMTIIGGLLTLWPPVASSGYWTNVAAAPPFALLVIVAGHIPLSIRAGLARCRNYRESIRRSASSVFGLLWLLEQDWHWENTSKENEQEKLYPWLFPAVFGGENPSTGALEDYLTYPGILPGLAQPHQPPRPTQDDSPLAPVRAFLVFNRLREDLSDLALTVRQLEQEPTALLSGSVNEVLRNMADVSTKFTSDLAKSQDLGDIRERSRALSEGVLKILQIADAMLPDWALPGFARSQSK